MDIMAAHDPTDYAAVEAEESRVALVEAIDEVLLDYQAALANWDTLSATQQNAVLKRHTQVLSRLLRFMHKQFEPFR